MNPSKMDGYVYTGFRLVIVPWRRQKSRQKRKLQESAFGKFSLDPSGSCVIENCSFGETHWKSRVDTRADRKSILLRNYVKMWNEKEHFDSVEGQGDFILDVFVKLFNFSFEIIGSFEKKKNFFPRILCIHF